MRDNDGGAAVASLVEGLLHGGLALRVQCRGRLVKEQEVGVADEGAGDRDALLLAARQLRAPLSHQSLVFLLKNILVAVI